MITEIMKKFFDIKDKKFHKKKKNNEDYNYNYNDFALWIGQDMSNTEYAAEYQENNFNNKQYSLQSLFNSNSFFNNNAEMISCKAGEVYFTPNLYINKKYNSNAERTGDYIAFLQDIFVDIDATYIDSEQVVLNELHKALKCLNIPKPHLTIKTSKTDKEGVKLHLHFLIDPLWIYDSRKGEIDNKQNKWHFKKVANSVVQALSKELPTWKFDKKKTREETAYARVPRTTNNKTNQKVNVLEFNNDIDRYSLDDLKEIKETEKQLESVNTSDYKLSSIFKHEQVQELLEGVEEGYRNDAQVSIAYALKADNVSKEKALNILRKQNQNCSKQRADKELKATVNSVYKNNKTISAKLLADTVKRAKGKNAKTDFRIVKSVRDSVDIASRNNNIYNSKQQTIIRTLKAVLYFKRNNIKFNKTDIAKKADVKKSTIEKKQYWNKIAEILKNEFYIKLIYNSKQHSYVFICLTNENSLNLTERQLKQISYKYFNIELDSKELVVNNSPPI